MVLVVKNVPAHARDIRDMDSIPGSGWSPGGGHGNPLQYPYLENPMVRGAWWATVHRVAKSQTWLKWLSTYNLYLHTYTQHIYTHTYLHLRLCICVHARVCMLSHFSHVWLFATLWAVACQSPLSVGFSRQEYWSGLPCPPPGDHPDPGIESASLTSPALAGGFFTTSATWEAHLSP